MVSESDTAVVLDTGAPANLACFRGLEPRNRIVQPKGYPRVTTYLASARFSLGDGHAADAPARNAGSKGQFVSKNPKGPALTLELPPLS